MSGLFFLCDEKSAITSSFCADNCGILKEKWGDCMARCSLCGGRLDFEKRCTLCGLDNTKNDDQYKSIMNRNNCDEGPLTHVHEDVNVSVQKRAKTYPQSEVPTYTKSESHGSRRQPTATHQRGKGSKSVRSESSKKGAGPILALVIAIFGIIPSLIGLIEESSYESDVQEYAYENYLEAGMYGVGVHIPEGTYTIGIDWGDGGLLEIMDYEGNELYVNQVYLLDMEDMSYIEDIYLSEGQILNVPSELLVYLYSDDADFYSVYGEENPLTESFVISGEAYAGVDFPAGLYDIWYEPSDEPEYGIVYYHLWNQQSQDVMLEGSQFLSQDMGKTVYRNVPLTEGSKIWLEDLTQITLTPSEVIAATE